MSNVAISGLPTLVGTPTGSDVLPIDNAGSTKSVTVAQLLQASLFNPADAAHATFGGSQTYIFPTGISSTAPQANYQFDFTSSASSGRTGINAAGSTTLVGVSNSLLSIDNKAVAVKVAVNTNGDVGFAGAVCVGGVALTVGANQVSYGGTTATSATAGTNGAVPAQVAKYIIVNVAGTNMKIPAFNV